MKFELKVLFLTASLLCVVAHAMAADFTYKEYVKTSELWKRGYVFGISQYMSTVAQPDEEAPYQVRDAYQRCFAASTEVALVRAVEAHVAKHSASVKDHPMAVVVIRALFDLCRREIEKARSPKAAPSRK